MGSKIKDPAVQWLVERIGEYGTFTNVPIEVYKLQNYCEFIAILIAKASKSPEKWDGLEKLMSAYDEMRERISNRYVEFFSKAIYIAETTQNEYEFKTITQKPFEQTVIETDLKSLQRIVMKFIANNKDKKDNVHSLF